LFTFSLFTKIRLSGFGVTEYTNKKEAIPWMKKNWKNGECLY